jgi:hypothetical protein
VFFKNKISPFLQKMLGNLCFSEPISTNFIAKFSSLEFIFLKHAYAGRGNGRKKGQMWGLDELTAFSTSPRGAF